MKNVNNLPLFSLNHIRFSQPIAYSVHRRDNTHTELNFTWVWFTAQDRVLWWYTAVHMHIYILSPYWAGTEELCVMMLLGIRLWLDGHCGHHSAVASDNMYCSIDDRPKVSNDQMNNLNKKYVQTAIKYDFSFVKISVCLCFFRWL